MRNAIRTLKSRIRATVFLTAAVISWHSIPSATSAQDLAGGGSATFLEKNGKTETIGDVFAEVDIDLPIGDTDRSIEFAMLGGFGESGSGFLGFGAKHFWMSSPGIYPGLGADLFYLNGGTAVDETTIFLGGVACAELLKENFPWKVRPFLAYYPAIMGDDATIFRFGVQLNDAE